MQTDFVFARMLSEKWRTNLDLHGNSFDCCSFPLKVMYISQVQFNQGYVNNLWLFLLHLGKKSILWLKGWSNKNPDASVDVREWLVFKNLMKMPEPSRTSHVGHFLVLLRPTICYVTSHTALNVTHKVVHNLGLTNPDVQTHRRDQFYYLDCWCRR